MKNYFKILTFLMAFTLFFACQNQDDPINDSNREESNSQSIRSEKISFDQFSRSEARETLTHLRKHLDINNQLLSESIEKENFIIRTDHINKIVNNGYESYTFIVRDNNKTDGIFENFVVQRMNEGFKYYRIKYTINEGASEKLYDPNIQEVVEDALDVDIFSLTLKNGSSSSCPAVYCIACSEGDSGCHGPEPVGSWNGPLCSGTTTVYDFSGCDDDGGGSDSDYEDGPYDTGSGNEPGTGGSGGGGGPNGPGGPSTSPIDPGLEDTSEMDDYNRERIDALNINFSLSQENFLVNNPYLIGEISNFLNQTNSRRARIFAIDAVTAWMNGEIVDFDDAYIETNTPDDNYRYQGAKENIPSTLVLANGDNVSVSFGVTQSDQKNANQRVSVDLIEGIKSALNEANNNLPSNQKITSIYVMATTNGKHSSRSNHSNGTAIDISRLNGVKMALSGVTSQIIELQEAFDNYIYVRENFGPHFKHKYSIEKPRGSRWNYNHPVGGHGDHIHFSVRR